MSALAGFLERLPGRQAVNVSENVADVGQDIRALGKSEALLLTGGRVRLRFAQSALWSAVAGFLGASFIAGLYFGLFQVNWYVHLGGVRFELFYLKHGWDNLFPYDWWALYRHAAFRDIPEPAFAAMAVKTLLASRRWWSVRVSNLRVVTSPFVVIGLTLALGVLGVWLIDFALPAAWAGVASAVGHPGFKVSARFLGTLSVPQLALGFIIGQVVHRYWAPVGATLQGASLDRVVDRRQAIAARADVTPERAVEIDNAGWHITPAWVRLPLSPPVIRERFAEMWRGNASVEVRQGHGKVIALATALAVLVTLLGLAGHYYVGSLGHSIPYIAP